ncbi:MAG: PAS domain-containing sensor histidine kinase [Candidatus Kapabacteria bacterium]|nr:PAS domain-containing sensor histidine kinase [Ignavibacteriota bacterium]MCW5884318.1 PAS domain-containing sensor histidine kinase [Candidatus Kapabacteria bacterium]
MKFLKDVEYKTPFIFLILSILWIVLSDALLFDYLTNSTNQKTISIIKGLVYVTTAAIIIHLLIRSDLNKIRSINKNLEDTNNYYVSIFENNHLPSLLLNHKTLKIQEVNKAALDLYGYTTDEFKNLHISDLFVKSHSHNVELEQFIKSSQNRNYIKTTHQIKNEELIIVEIFSGPLILNGNLNILTIINDITIKSKAEKALRESEAKYKKLVENIPDVFYLMSQVNGFQYISPQIKNLIGFNPSKNDMTSDIILNHIYPEDKQKYLNFRKIVFETFEPDEINYRIQDSGGQIKWLQERVFSIQASIDDVMLEGVITDYTEKKLLMDELVQAHTKINQSLKVKNVILSNLNHELRTPLNGILGFANLINKNVVTGNEINEYTGLIIESANRLNLTLNSLLTLNEIELGHRKLFFEEAGVKDFLRLIYDSNSKFVKMKNLTFDIDVKDDFKFYTDINILSQIFFNLIDNAVKFTNTGKITLKGEFITIGGIWIQLSVIDTGIGMMESEIESIFEPFRQGSEGINRNFDGMGIGLTICFKLIKLLEGKIEVVSSPGQGSEFKLLIPFKIPKEEPVSA